MSCRELVFGARVEHGHQLVFDTARQLLARNRLQRVARVKVAADDFADCCGVSLSHAFQRIAWEHGYAPLTSNNLTEEVVEVIPNPSEPTA
jgi:hypothetical protein